MPLVRHCADTILIVEAAAAGLRSTHQPDFRYAKARVTLMELQPDSIQQGEPDLAPQEMNQKEGRARLMTALDQLNQRCGRGTVLVASSGLDGDQWAWLGDEARTAHPAAHDAQGGLPVVRA